MNEFYLYARDEKFDLINGTLSGTHHFLFGDQMERAQAVFEGRTNEQAAYAIESLDWMLREGSLHLFKQTMEVLNTKEHHFISRVKALRAFMPHFEIADQSQLPNASWADYFAALTLAYVTEALYAADKPAYDGEPIEEHMNDIDWESALEAMDAACCAEQLLSETKLKNRQPRTSAESGSLGGKIRASKYSNIKNKVFKLYENKYHTRPSNRDAAKRILNDLSDDDLSVLRTDDKLKRIEKWIKEYKERSDKKLNQYFTIKK